MPTARRLRALLLLAILAACEGDRPTRPTPPAIAGHGSRPTPELLGAATVAVDAGPDTTVLIPAALDFRGSVADTTSPDAPWSYTIAWGDDSITTGTTTSALGVAASHTYTREGVDTLVFTVSDSAGDSAVDSAVITVVDRVGRIVVTPALASLDVGANVQFTATAYGLTGNQLAGRVFTWGTTSASIATVSATGLVAGVAAGTVRISATTAGVSGYTTLYVYGLPLAPFHLPDSLFAKPYTGVFRGATPQTILATLKTARRKHYRVVLYLASSSKTYSNPDSSFSLALWQQSIDRYRGIDISSYIADGTVIGHYLIAEPSDPTNWGGAAVSPADIDAAAAYSKSIWPALPTGAGSEASDLETGAPYRYLDFAFSQYRDKKGDVALWLDAETASAKRASLGLMLSINLLDGNLDGTAYSASRLTTIGTTLAASPYACALTMWKYDSAYFADSAVKVAMSRIAKTANRRPRHRCLPD